MPRIAALLIAAWAGACGAASGHADLRSIAQWAYPQAAPGRPTHHSPDEIIRASDSRRTFRYKDLFGPDSGAADWFPDSHPPLPAIVAHGNAPGVESCGGCHTVNGEGVPATAALAGLPRDYMLEQIDAFRRGLRGAHAPESATFMAKEAKGVGDHDIAQAVDYFSHLAFKPDVRVVESASVPRTHWRYFALEAEPGGRREPIGQRIIEMPVHPADYEHYDTHAGFIAYVPPGSLRRGARLANLGNGSVLACTSCHGDRLQGLGTAPPLAGRSPTYIARELLLFASGQRDSPNAAPMRHEAEQLTLKQAISAAAYAASLGGNPRARN
jgi:cytochrome c553